MPSSIMLDANIKAQLQSYFTKLFTERYHMTPSGCRKK